MGNGQCAMGNGQWAMGNGQCAMGNGQWAMSNKQCAMDKWAAAQAADHAPAQAIALACAATVLSTAASLIMN